MKLDTNRSYGTITGHEEARFEQDGILFDASGEQLGGGDEVVSRIEKKAAARVESELDAAKTFLLEILRGGAVDKTKVAKEAEIRNLSWDKVRDAFAALPVQSFKQRNAVMWKLLEGAQ